MQPHRTSSSPYARPPPTPSSRIGVWAWMTHVLKRTQNQVRHTEVQISALIQLAVWPQASRLTSLALPFQTTTLHSQLGLVFDIPLGHERPPQCPKSDHKIPGSPRFQVGRNRKIPVSLCLVERGFLSGSGAYRQGHLTQDLGQLTEKE